MTASNTVPDQGRKIVKATDLHRHVGEWINDAFVGKHPVQLAYAADSANPHSDEVVAVVVSRGMSIPTLLSAERSVDMATQDEIDREQQSSDRRVIADGLHALADLIDNTNLPIRSHGIGISITMHGDLSKGELAAVGAALGIEPTRSYGRRFGVEWSSTGKGYGPGVRASWDATYPACPYVRTTMADGTGRTLWEQGVDGVEGDPCKFEAGHDGGHAVKKTPAA